MKKTKQQKFWSNLWQSAKEGLKLEWKDLIWIAASVITCLIAIPFFVNWQMKDTKDAIIEQNVKVMEFAPTSTIIPTPTCPGIADLAGNCMKQVEYQFTVPKEVETPTPQPVCTPMACDGILICPHDDGCPGGCGMVCKVVEPQICKHVVWVEYGYDDNGNVSGIFTETGRASVLLEYDDYLVLEGCP